MRTKKPRIELAYDTMLAHVAAGKDFISAGDATQQTMRLSEQERQVLEGLYDARNGEPRK